jgi:hypothetical protein
VSSREQITRLEALLARVKERADMPRAAPLPTIALPVTATVPPTGDARVVLALESRTRVVETTVELDEADLVPASQATPVPPEAEGPVVEIEIGEPDEAPPPSSKRPIPMEAIAEAQQHEPPPPPPPESGTLVASVPAFDDDFTGVREASSLLPPLEKDAPPIEVQQVERPKPQPVHEMEAEIGGGHPAPEASEPRRISDVAPAPATPLRLQPEITKASVPASPVAVDVRGSAQAFKPQSFGELLDATLGL